MPLVVDEIVIAVEVSNRESGGAGPSGTPTDERQAIVSECVERVLDVLRRGEER